MASVYQIKKAKFFGRDVPIFLQNINGPCPLLAIANVLSLRNQLHLPLKDARDISQDRLVTMVAEKLLDMHKDQDGSLFPLGHLEQNLSDCFEVMSKLTTGIDVNIRYHSIDGFEPTKETAMFDLLGISLVHGWLVDPKDKTTAEVFGHKTYNELVELLVAGTGEKELERLSDNLRDTVRSFSFRAQSQGAASPRANIPQSPRLAATENASTAASASTAPEESDGHAQPVTEVADSPSEPLAATEEPPVPLAEQVSGADVPVEASPEPVEEHGERVDAQAALVQEEVPSANPGTIEASSSAQPSECQLGTDSKQPSSDDTGSVPVTEGVHNQAWIVGEFLNSTCSQLTEYGLSQLLNRLAENQLAVFFRNNHFSTLFKRNGMIYLLVTDQGYQHESNIVWERLDGVDGDTTFCDSDFEPFVPHREAQRVEDDPDLQAAILASQGLDPGMAHRPLPPVAATHSVFPVAGSPSHDADLALALHLQQQEELEALRVRQEALMRDQELAVRLSHQGVAPTQPAPAPQPRASPPLSAEPGHYLDPERRVHPQSSRPSAQSRPPPQSEGFFSKLTRSSDSGDNSSKEKCVLM